MEKLRLNFNTNSDFMNVSIADSSLGNREKSAMLRARFTTLGDIVNAIKKTDDLFKLSKLDERSGKPMKIRNLGVATAAKIIPGLYAEYISSLTGADLDKEINNFCEMNRNVLGKCPELAVVTLDPGIFKSFWVNYAGGVTK